MVVRLVSIGWLALGCFLVSCDKRAELDIFVDVEGAQWHYEDVKTMDWICRDTAARYDVLLNVRHAGNYEWQNVYVVLRVVDSLGNKRVFRKSVSLCDGEGYWLGKGLGNWKVASLLLERGMRFKTAGQYRMSLEQHMRVNPLEGIGQVGLKIVKRETENPPN